MEIYLIRHGDCYRAGIENYDESKKTVNSELTQKGYLQAQKLAERCSDTILTGFIVVIMSCI